MQKVLPFTKEEVEDIISEYPTPVYIYDEAGIRETARKLKEAFSWAPGFKEFYAVKACPNPYILEIMMEEGFGADCSSMTELVLAEKVGLRGEKIMFTSNDTPDAEYQKALELGAIINFDGIEHIPFYMKHVGELPEVVSLRFNPGPLEKGSEFFGGDPVQQKYGHTVQQLFDAYSMLQDLGVRRFGLHTMFVSNRLDGEAIVGTGRMLYDHAYVAKMLGIPLEFLNTGGGMGIPYHPDDEELDLGYVSSGMQEAYIERIVKNSMDPIHLFMENGRYMTGPHGYLVTTVLHKKHTYKNFVGVNGSMANLMRPALYGAHHQIIVLGKEDWPLTNTYDVVGSLCENNDKFAVDRKLPYIEVGNNLVHCDAGAHGWAMGFQYNGKPRSAEVLRRTDGSRQLIRRAEKVEDLLATLDFSELKNNH